MNEGFAESMFQWETNAKIHKQVVIGSQSSHVRYKTAVPSSVGFLYFCLIKALT